MKFSILRLLIMFAIVCWFLGGVWIFAHLTLESERREFPSLYGNLESPRADDWLWGFILTFGFTFCVPLICCGLYAAAGEIEKRIRKSLTDGNDARE